MSSSLGSILTEPRQLNYSITGADLGRWLRAALARNPFYILSALLLLYSIRLLSTDSRIFSSETPQLFFNFFSVEFYELLLAGTAIALARKKIWYDSGLLIGIENMFVFIPFMLVSQALLLSNGIATGFCCVGCLLVAGRFGCIKRWLPMANIPVILMVIGALLLCLNVVLPISTRILHQDANLALWDKRGAIISACEWTWLMPALMALAFALPSRRADLFCEGGALYTRRCFPLLCLALWMGGMGAHLCCIGYVYGLPWNAGLAIPVVWTAAWVLWKRRLDLDFVPEKMERITASILLTGPAWVILGAQLSGIRNVEILAAMSAVIYGGMAVLQRQRLPLHLAMICAAMTFAAAGTHHAEIAVGILGVYFVLWTLTSKRPDVGMLGGIMLSCLVLGILRDTESVNAAINLGLVYILMHSLRWERGEADRRCFGIIWLGQGAIWISMDPSGGWGTFASGIAVLAVYFGARGLTGRWASRIIPLSATSSIIMAPMRQAILILKTAPIGLLILIGSFILFTIGTLAALTKTRWLPQRPPVIVNPNVNG